MAEEVFLKKLVARGKKILILAHFKYHGALRKLTPMNWIIVLSEKLP